MTDRKSPRRRKLAHEILGLIGISALLSGILFWILSHAAAAIAESYCFQNDVVMTEFDWLAVDRWIFGASGIICATFFSLLFLALLSDRMAYIRTITKGIDSLRMGQANSPIPLEGKNELTELADAINFLSATQQQLREKELSLAREKEQFIRTLSHDIRTPLTSILAYSEYLAGDKSVSGEAQKAYLQTIQKKALQIRELTELLLDGGKRNPEHFADAHLLFRQLAAEFEEGLEDRFPVQVDLSGCPSFAGTFDVQELRRVFDNLSSNVHKYAAPDNPVCMKIWAAANGLNILQTNTVRADMGQESGHKLGINSIRRIVQHYAGRVSVLQEADSFTIEITLSDY